jgi:heme A synthase
MIFKKDNFIFGAILGFLGPILGIIIFKMTKFQANSFSDTMNFMLFQETGHRTLSVALSLSLLVNAVLFTIYINSRKDKTAKGIFALTCVYGLLVLCIKTFS